MFLFFRPFWSRRRPNRGLRKFSSKLASHSYNSATNFRIALPFFSFRAALNLALQSRFNSPHLVCGQPRSDFFGTDEIRPPPSGQCRHE